MKRIEGDRYYTPDAVALALVGVLPEIDGRVLEPHAGGGSFVRALADKNLTISDVDPGAPSIALGLELEKRVHIGDFLEYDTPHYWIIGNPPYRDAEKHVRHALQLAPRVAFLLRLAFLESKRRTPFWRDHPPRHVWVLQRRPSFVGGGKTDGCAYGWFFWDRYWSCPPELGWV